MKTILKTEPPEKKDFEAAENRTKPPSRRAQTALARILDAATNFHGSYGILPSIRCLNLAEDLERAGEIDPDVFSGKYGLKAGLIGQADAQTLNYAANILREAVAPAYAKREKVFTGLIRTGFRRLGREKECTSFLAASIGTPFVEISLDDSTKGFFINFLRPTSARLSRNFHEQSGRLDHPDGVAFLLFEATRRNELIVRDIERSKSKAGKQSLAPYGILEQLFLLTLALTKRKTAYLATTDAVFCYWKKFDEEMGTSYTDALKGDILRTELRVYDELGGKYGQLVDKIPGREFMRLLGRRVPGWKISLL